MQLDDSEQDQKGQQEQISAQQQPLGAACPEIEIDQGVLVQQQSFAGMNFKQLCETNPQGGDPRVYEAIRQLLTGVSPFVVTEDLHKAFDQGLLQHLTQASLASSSSDSEGEGSSPPVKHAEMNIRSWPDNTLYFKGFPECDYLRQINIVLHMWNKLGHFPIVFVKMEGFTDETDTCVQHLNSITHLVIQLFETLHQADCTEELFVTLMKDFLLNLGPRGLLTMLGQRKTAGSQDIAWPSVSELKGSFNQPHTVLTEEQKQRQKNVPKLTVGARALTKHCHRSSEGFWGQFRGSELQKNQDANAKLDEVLRDCVWFNVHIIVKQEIIIECRLEQGYGMRWTIDGRFRGFLEPQMSDGHEKGWRH